jgi:hypothetical protein
MRHAMNLVVGSVLMLIAISVAPLAGIAYAACSASDIINSTTASDAARRIESAGYTQVQDLAKSCDNAWHGTALLNGTRTRVVWTGEGQVLTEGD